MNFIYFALICFTIFTSSSGYTEMEERFLDIVWNEMRPRIIYAERKYKWNADTTEDKTEELEKILSKIKSKRLPTLLKHARNEPYERKLSTLSQILLFATPSEYNIILNRMNYSVFMEFMYETDETKFTFSRALFNFDGYCMEDKFKLTLEKLNSLGQLREYYFHLGKISNTSRLHKHRINEFYRIWFQRILESMLDDEKMDYIFQKQKLLQCSYFRHAIRDTDGKYFETILTNMQTIEPLKIMKFLSKRDDQTNLFSFFDDIYLSENHAEILLNTMQRINEKTINNLLESMKSKRKLNLKSKIDIFNPILEFENYPINLTEKEEKKILFLHGYDNKMINFFLQKQILLLQHDHSTKKGNLIVNMLNCKNHIIAMIFTFLFGRDEMNQSQENLRLKIDQNIKSLKAEMNTEFQNIQLKNSKLCNSTCVVI